MSIFYNHDSNHIQIMVSLSDKREKYLPMNKTKLSRDLKLLLSLFAFRDVSDLFLGTFFVSFIMHSATNEIVAISGYRLFQYAATCAGFFLIANWCKRYNKVTVFALNLVPKIALLLSIVLLETKAVQYVIPLGILYGLCEALYCLPVNAMIGEKVHADAMGNFFGTKMAIKYVVKLVVPVVLGFFIDLGSYEQVAAVLLGLTVIEFLMVCGMRGAKHKSNSPIDFIGFGRCMLRFPIIRQMFAMEVLRGFGNGLLGTVITMYTVYMFHTDLNLGILTTVFAVFAILTARLFGRWGKGQYYPHFLTVSALIMMGAMAWFVVDTTPLAFIGYNFAYSTAFVIIDQINSVCTFNLSKSRCVTANHKIEYFVFRDFALFIGRWVGFVGLMYVGVFGGYQWLRYYLILITVAMVLVGVIAAKISKGLRGR